MSSPRRRGPIPKSSQLLGENAKINPKQTSAAFKLRGVGKQIAKHLARLNILSASDLLFHFPARYLDRTQIQPMRQVRPGDEVVVEGVIQSVQLPKGGRTKLLCELNDGTGKIYLRFFHVLSFQKNILKAGTRLRCYQDVRLGKLGLEMVHPEFQVINPDKPAPIEQNLTPIYPATEGLSQYMLRKLTGNALDWMSSSINFQELLPSEILNKLSLPEFKSAVQFIHRPVSDTKINELIAHQTLAQRRLIFEELLVHRISLVRLKELFQSHQGIPLAQNGKLAQQFLAQLPFSLTAAQARVTQEIKADLQRANPMLRLVQGDVGSGKTVVAALAMLQAIESGYQAAMMAPTELLAEQHFRNLKQWFEPLGLNVVFLAGSIKKSNREKTFAMAASGEAQVVIGTHALFQQEVDFAKLALIVVDEQHRFGVQQRALLRDKGKENNLYPHQLMMTATPIPRTLSMSFYADLDCSVIDELPPGRTPIMTSVISSARREDVIARVREACQQGRQAYWVCPLIEESEVINCQAATTLFEQLQKLLPELTIALIHGRMRAAEKEVVMEAFKDGRANLLVATTVIEVGVDIPNASLMIIENAERLGLSQLHQLRGRVGRGSAASHCVLFYQYPLSQMAKERLAVMRDTNDGFKIAQRDLELRGPGEVFGTKQTGELTFRVADLMRDSDMLAQVQQTADTIMQHHSHLIEPLVKRWLRRERDYGKV